MKTDNADAVGVIALQQVALADLTEAWAHKCAAIRLVHSDPDGEVRDRNKARELHDMEILLRRARSALLEADRFIEEWKA